MKDIVPYIVVNSEPASSNIVCQKNHFVVVAVETDINSCRKDNLGNLVVTLSMTYPRIWDTNARLKIYVAYFS